MPFTNLPFVRNAFDRGSAQDWLPPDMRMHYLTKNEPRLIEQLVDGLNQYLQQASQSQRGAPASPGLQQRSQTEGHDAHRAKQ